jgi:hypothetical protein
VDGVISGTQGEGSGVQRLHQLGHLCHRVVGRLLPGRMWVIPNPTPAGRPLVPPVNSSVPPACQRTNAFVYGVPITSYRFTASGTP